MLPPQHRLRSTRTFGAVVRSGRKVASGALVLHLDRDPASAAPPVVGFTVGKTVGNAVVRHRVSRQLRHACAALVASLPPGSRLVVRALPASATAGQEALGRDLRSGLASLTGGPGPRS